MNDTCIIIPARYESHRLPGKPLVMLKGIPMVIRTALTCIETIGKENTYIATNDSRIEDTCIEYDVNCIRTSSSCLTGTDRVAEAYLKLGKGYKTIVNVQGDEPLVLKENIIKIIETHKAKGGIITGAAKIENEQDFRSYNIVKFAISKETLIYASRAGIPSNKIGEFYEHFCHVPIYAFDEEELLLFYSRKTKSYLEQIEDVEILRSLELGSKVNISYIDRYYPAVDVKDDIKKVLKYL